MLDNWQRIEKIVNWTGLSVNAFSRCIGLKRAENLYQIRKGNYGISKELAELITTKYSTINKSWLLTGAGNMFLEESLNMVSNIPYYKVDILRLMLAKEFFSPSIFLGVPMFNGCELAALFPHNSMEPDIPFGSIVFIRKADITALLPGNIYLIISPIFNGVRFIRREPESPRLRLVPRNKEDYDDVIINIKDVERIYEIKGYIMTK